MAKKTVKEVGKGLGLQVKAAAHMLTHPLDMLSKRRKR